MILHGHVSRKSYKGWHQEVNRDTYHLLRCFIPKEKEANMATLGAAARTLHLAFRGMKADEVYDQLMLCLVKTINKYDPFYSDKVRQVCELIGGEDFHNKKKFPAADVTRAMGYECASYLRMLAKRLFLVARKNETTGEVRYERGELWPPPASFFNAGAVGLPYFVSKWFRFYLVEFINDRMGELEAKDGVLQLRSGASGVKENNVIDMGLPHTHGNYRAAHGSTTIMADVSLMESPCDIGTLNVDWVNGSKTGLFAGLTKSERHLLYCVFARNMDWESLARTFNKNVRETKAWYADLMTSLREKVAPANILPSSEDPEMGPSGVSCL
jgi:hypothetical protein